jgi:hypothetical protein
VTKTKKNTTTVLKTADAELSGVIPLLNDAAKAFLSERRAQSGIKVLDYLSGLDGTECALNDVLENNLHSAVYHDSGLQDALRSAMVNGLVIGVSAALQKSKK